MSQVDDINMQSMNIILHAGNSHDYFNEAMNLAEKGDFEKVDELLKKADEELVEAHRIQTKMIQDAIEEEDPNMTVLFIHAQDTLMTIQTESHLTKRLISLYSKLNSKE